MNTQDTRILTLLRIPGTGPKTARQIAEDVYGLGTESNAIANILKRLVEAGHLKRHGAGHRVDPYRYEVT